MINPCEGCLEKQRKIDRLLEEIASLKAKLRYQDNRNHKGEARLGHKGHGRKAHSEETADEIIPIDPGEICPDCGEVLELKKIQDRTVIESEPVRPKKILDHLSHKW